MTRRAVAQKERCAQVELRGETKTARTAETKEARTMTRTTRTVKELRAQAKAAGIKGYSRMRKAELESALGDVEKPDDSRKDLRETKKAIERPVIGIVNGKAIHGPLENSEDMIDEEAMERESEGIKKLYPDEWAMELEAMNRAELDYLCQKFGLQMNQSSSKEEKRRKLLKYLEEGSEANSEQGSENSKIA